MFNSNIFPHPAEQSPENYPIFLTSSMIKLGSSYFDSACIKSYNSLNLFDKRVLQHIYDNTFYHESALKIGKELHKNGNIISHPAAENTVPRFRPSLRRKLKPLPSRTTTPAAAAARPRQPETAAPKAG